MSYRMRCMFVFALVTLLSACIRYGSPDLQEAEELSREGRFDEAITAYRRHMDERLAFQKRPEWENPYFYLLLIGDIELGRGSAATALSTYEEAERRGVHATLISDRFRSVARWYEERGEFEDARRVLETYRLRDPLLFESMLDRIVRKLTEQEDAALRKAGPTSEPSGDTRGIP